MTTAGYHGAVPSTGLSTVLFALLALTATDRTAAASCGSDGPTAACIKAKAVAALDRASRADVLPLVGPVTLVRDASRGRQQRSTAALTEGQLRDVPDHVLDSMLYEGMAGALDGRAVHVGLPDVTADQLKTVVEEGETFDCFVSFQTRFFVSFFFFFLILPLLNIQENYWNRIIW